MDGGVPIGALADLELNLAVESFRASTGCSLASERSFSSGARDARLSFREAREVVLPPRPKRRERQS